MAADSLIADTTARIFADLGDPRGLRPDGGDGWKAPLWQALDAAGLPLLWVPEEAGGIGGSFVEGLAALEVAGAHACALPLAETMAGAWLAAGAGLDVPSGPFALLPAGRAGALRFDGKGRLTASCPPTPFGASAATFVAVVEDAEGAPQVALFDRPNHIAPSQSLAGDDLGAAVFDHDRPRALAPLPAAIGREGLLLVAAATRSALIAGALGALLDICVGYAQEREAFGRTISKFQAVQHNLAGLAGEVAAATVTAQAAGWALDRAGDDLSGAFLDVAAAKIRAGEAAGTGAAIAHQVHGAIGFTAEHVLHRYSHRLWSWRDDYGTEAFWAERLGRHVAAAGAEGFWGLLTGEPEPTLQAGSSWV